MKVTKDLFVWKTISHPMASQFYYQEDSFPVYILHDDDSETLIDSEEELLNAYYEKATLGIEVGRIDLHEIAAKADIIPVFWSKEDIRCTNDDDDNPFDLTEDEIEQVRIRLEMFHDAEIGINWDVIKCQIQMVIDERSENHSN